ncbi:DUF3800 domain-containing protein [Methanococcoides sp. SA1]|nr:DUF3800 domain-containing protein [Methanococcoides sp. SA1]
MKLSDTTHLAFSDDSKHESGVYNSLSVVTIEKNQYEELSNDFQRIMRNTQIGSEFKWIKLRSANYRFAAINLIDFVFNNRAKIRIDTIIWNLEDSRHKDIIGRDDNENLVRMYYHLISTTTGKRWPKKDVVWNWYPDQQSCVNWETHKDCITTKKYKNAQGLFEIVPEFENVDINEIVPSDSKEYCFIQIADFFAGIASYSYGEFVNYKNWATTQSKQIRLFGSKYTIKDFSNRQRERFKIMQYLNSRCKGCSLQVAFNSKLGFFSHNPDSFINFWLYEPQHYMDKAPIRS